MTYTPIQWVCSKCGKKNLTIKKPLLVCSSCGHMQKAELLHESEFEDMPLPENYWEAPFEEDSIFWNNTVLQRAYSCIFRSETPGEYLLFDKNGRGRVIHRKKLLLTKMAIERTYGGKNFFSLTESAAESYPDKMWDADADKFSLNQEAFQAMNLTFLGAVRLSGINGYYILDNKTGKWHFYTSWICEKLGLFN